MYFCVVLCIVCFVTYSVLSVCICVLNYCRRVATQLQLNISYHISFRRQTSGLSNSLQPHLAYLNHPKALVASESYHVVITTIIPLNTTARQLERNRGKYGGRGSLTSGKRCGVEASTWKMFDWLQFNYIHKPPLLEKLILPQIAKKFTIFNGIRSFTFVFAGDKHWTLSWLKYLFSTHSLQSKIKYCKFLIGHFDFFFLQFPNSIPELVAG